MRRALATLTAAGLLAVAPLTAAAALEGDGATAPTTEQPAGQSAQDHAAHPRLRRVAHRIAAKAAAEEIGVSVEELRDAVLGGQTIAQYAESKGVSTEAVESAVATALDEAIDRAAANGRITDERAAQAKEKTADAAQRIVTSLPRRLQETPQQ